MNGLLEAIKRECVTADREPERVWLSYPDAPGFWWAKTERGVVNVCHAIRLRDGSLVVEFCGSDRCYGQESVYAGYAFSRVDELR